MTRTIVAKKNTRMDRPDLAAALLPLLGAIANLKGRPHVVRKHRAVILHAVKKLIEALYVEEPDPSQRELIAFARSGKATWHDILASSFWAGWEGFPESARRAEKRRAQNDETLRQSRPQIEENLRRLLEDMRKPEGGAQVVDERKPMRKARSSRRAVAAHRSTYSSAAAH